MINITDGSQRVEQNYHAEANNSEVPDAAEAKVSGIKSGGTEAKRKIYLFSRELAEKINPKQADFTASIIIYGLYLWQNKRIGKFGYVPLVNGQRGAYRSLSELRIDYPWLSEEAIRKALKRAETALKGEFIVDEKNAGADRGKLHFWISPKLAKKYKFTEVKKKGLVQFDPADVKNYGLLEAILIANIEHITQEARNGEDPIVDEGGRIYRELSPSKLTKRSEDKNGKLRRILPRSRNAVTKAIANLVENEVLVQHRERSQFYTLNQPEQRVSEVASRALKVASAAPKVASRALKVARQSEVLSRRSREHSDLQQISKTPDTNTDSNADTKTDTKCLLLPTASLRDSVVSPSLQTSFRDRKLMELVDHGLAVFRQNQGKIPRKFIHDGDEFCEVPSLYHARTDIDIKAIRLDYVELPYDLIPIDRFTGKPFTRKDVIEDAILGIKTLLQCKGMKYQTKHLDLFRQLMRENDHLEDEHIDNLINYLQPQNRLQFCNEFECPKKGWDEFHFARRISNLDSFFRYLPQLVLEYCRGPLFEPLNEYEEQMEVECLSEKHDSGMPMFCYKNLVEPYFSLAFTDNRTIPVTYVLRDEVQRDSQLPACDRLRPVYFDELVNPVFVTEFDRNPLQSVYR